VLFTKETLGLSMDAMGKVFAWGAVASAVAYFPIGWLCDRFSSLSVTLVSLIFSAVGVVLAWLFVKDWSSYLVYTTLFSLPSVGWSLGGLALTMKLFPEQNFGQFSSALHVFSCIALIPGNYLMGQFMDLFHSDYRMTFLWSSLCYGLTIYPMILILVEWKKNSGPHGYVPPLPP
jgi:MFS family permease